MTSPYLRAFEQGNLVILLFHGVVQRSDYEVRNYTRKHLEADAFRSVLQDFARASRAITMDEVVERHVRREPYREKAFAVTFDDGFENNLSVAAPILRELGIPATFYVSTALVEENAMSWIDKIEHLLEATPRGRLLFPWSKEPKQFSGRDEKIAFLKEIRAKVKSDPAIDPERFALSLHEQLGRDLVRASSDPLDLKLNWPQVRELQEDPLFLVGGHSHHHLNMAFLPPRELQWQVETSIRLLREKAGVPSRHYAYPEGLAHCYSEQVIQELQSHGVVCSPTAIDGANTHETGLFDLRRVMVS